MLAEILWTLPIDQHQWPRPEDVELAEVCGRLIVFILDTDIIRNYSANIYKITFYNYNYECDFFSAEAFM